MHKVLNFAQYINIEGLPTENDISLKTYSDLGKRYGVECEFVRPVGQNPKLVALFRNTSKIRRRVFANKDYVDSIYNIKVHFYRGSFPYIHELPLNTKWLAPMEFSHYSRFLDDKLLTFKPDLLHAHSIAPDGYYAMQLNKRYTIPYILTLRGSFSKIYNSKRGKEIMRNASAITTPSYTLWSNLKNICDIQLVPHGIDDIWFNYDNKKFDNQPIRLITVSRLLELKNIQIVLRVISRLIREGIGITYEIIGDGEYRERLENLTKELSITDFVRFHGQQNSNYIMNVYKRSNVFVMLSYPETFGRSYFEAAAQGLYLIGAKNTGAYGHFIESEASFIDIDEDQLSETLKKLDQEEYDFKSSRMVSKIDRFRNSKIIEKYYNIIAASV